MSLRQHIATDAAGLYLANQRVIALGLAPA